MNIKTIVISSIVATSLLSGNASAELQGQKAARHIYKNLQEAYDAASYIHGEIQDDCATNTYTAWFAIQRVNAYAKRAAQLYVFNCYPSDGSTVTDVNIALNRLKTTCQPMSCNGHQYGRCNKQRKTIRYRLKRAQGPVSGFLAQCITAVDTNGKPLK